MVLREGKLTPWQELKSVLENWEDEYGRPFQVHGKRYLDELYASAAKAAPPRAKTPSNTGMPSKSATVSRSTAPSRAGTIRGGAPPTRSKTPVSNYGASVSRHTLSSSVSSVFSASTSTTASASTSTSISTAAQKSPSKIPSRTQLGGTQGRNSPERRMQPPAREDAATMRRKAPPMAPPPRMKDLFIPPEPSPVETPMNRFAFNRGERSESIVRNVAPEDPYDDRPSYVRHSQTMSAGYIPAYPTPSVSSGSSRQISQASSTGTAATGVTMQSGSENWETFSEQSDDAPEEEVDFHQYKRQMKRYTPEGGHASSPRPVQGKKIRGIRNVGGSGSISEHEGSLVPVVEGSDAGWTDDGDGY